MVQSKDYYDAGLAFHGHKCPAMPLGLRTGEAAMNALGVSRAKDGELVAILELGDNHCATCFADGVQMITGCTFGKGNIKKIEKGKWGLTLIDKKSGKAVRVVPLASAMLVSKQSDFMQKYRSKGIPASEVPEEVVAPLIHNVMNAPESALIKVGPVMPYELKEKKSSYNGFVCEECGEMTVMEYGRIKGDKKVCIDCAEKE
jgi:formylmethanofuran dehydrogenase subunit E